MNESLIKQLKSQLSFLRTEWEEVMDALSQLESLEIRGEEIRNEILELELLIKEEKKKV